MSLFGDLFGGKAAKEAAEKTRAHYAQVQASANQLLDDSQGRSMNYLGGGMNAARDALKGGYNTATGAINESAGSAQDYLRDGGAQGMQALTSSADKAAGAWDSVAGLGQKYGAGTNLYMDALGINGAEGNARAQAAFNAGPGTQFAIDQGLEAINRRRNAGGMLDSGNADRDATQFAMGLANQSYGDWRNSLAGFISPEMSTTTNAAQGKSSVWSQQGTNQANLLSQLAERQANVATNRGQALANLASGQGTTIGNLEYGYGKDRVGLETGTTTQKVNMAKDFAGPYTNTYNQEAQARMQGGANLIGLGLNLGKMAMGAA